MSSSRAVPRLVGVALLCLALLATSAGGEFVFDDDLEDLIAEESNVDEELAPGSVLLPSDVFNDGKPFYVERDPSTGAIDFNHKKTGNQIEMDDERRPYESIKESYVSDKKDVIVHHSTPNFHDFLNLPKMYSPENFVSISSSYANLKYQGSNKGSNHRDQAHIVSVTAVAPTTTTAPSSSTKFYFSRPQYGRPTTSTPGSSPTYTYPVTSGRPITTSTTSKPAPTSTSTTTTTTTTVAITEEETTTGSPPKQLFTRYPYKSTIKNKYLETSEQTRKKFFLPSTLALPGPTTTTTTTTERAPSTPVRSSTYYSPSVRPQWPTTTTTTTPVPTTTLAPSSTAPAHPVRFVDDTDRPPSGAGSKIKFTMPALKYEGSRPAPFRRMPVQPGSGGPGSSDREQGNGGSASTYNKIELPKNPAVMSLSDIFSTLEQKKRLEAEGNRVEAVEQGTSTTPPAIVLLDDRRTTTVYGEGPKIEQSVDLSDHYVSYEVHHQPSSGRPIAFQTQQQQQQPAYQVHQPNGHRPQQPAMDTAAGGQYVQYEVQQPQLNVVQFGAVPSMNSVVISPNQHSATFVLGSQQSVGGAGGVGGAVGPGGHFVGSVSQDSPAVGTAAALIAGRPPYQMGQVLDEPHDPAGAAIVGSVQVKPQDIIKTTSVRFPSESDDKYDNAPIISGTHKSEVLPPNGHSAPVRAGLGPGDMSSVVFPAAATHDLHEVSNRIVFDSAAPQPPADTLNRHEFAVAPNPHYPADLPEQLTPPSAAQDLKPRPPSAPLRPPIPSQGPPSFRYSEIQRRPATFPTDRTRPTLLPNILPQFRPNAKISHGHPPPPHLRESGTYRVPAGMFVKAGGPPPLRKPLPYHQQQFGGPNRLPTTRTRPGASPPSRTPVSAELENRRYYRLPPAPPSPPAVIKDRVYNLQPSRLQAPPPPPPPPPLQQPAQPVEQPLDEPLEEHEFHRNPPQILKNLLRDELSGQQRPKLEPVVTLQMLQSKRRVEEGGTPTSGVELGASTAHPQVPLDAPGTRDRPVYVVYPVKSTPMKLERPGVDTIIVRGEHPPPPPPPAMVISPGTEYQNTPFSIASHFEQEPILVAKHKKVAHPHANSVKLNFPYNMEKPDPHALTHGPVAVHPAPAQDLAAEYSEYNLGEEPSGGLGAAQEQDQDLISSKLQRFHSSTTDSTPIAIAYTPTESSLGPAAGVPNSMRYNKPPMGAPGGPHNHNNNYYYSVYGETQTEVSHLKLDDVDEFGNPSRRYEQSFQAPFQASMSLDPVKVTNPYEGWAVVTSSPQALALQHSKPSPPPPPPEPAPDRNTIDRSDTSATGAEDDQVAVTPGERPVSLVTPAASAGPFDPNSFQPELQGGFRPILGADVKLSEQLNPDPQRSSIADLFADDPPVAVAAGEQSAPVPKPQATKLQLVPKDTKPKVVKKEEPDGMDELDLEAFFDRLSKDYDDGELDDVTMSDETSNGTLAGSGEKQRAVGEGRSSQGAKGIVADEAAGTGTEETSRTPETTTTPVVNEKPTSVTEAT